MNTPFHNKWRRKCFFFFPILIIGLFGISAIVMLLWNLVLPSVSTLLSLTYWQAMGLLVLCRILFGGFHFRRKFHGRGTPSTHVPFKDKFMEMNDEERHQFINQWKKRCCTK